MPLFLICQLLSICKTRKKILSTKNTCVTWFRRIYLTFKSQLGHDSNCACNKFGFYSDINRMWLYSWLDKALKNYFLVKMSAFLILFHLIVKVGYVQSSKLCKVTRLTCKLTNLYKAVELSYKMMQLYHVTDGKNLDIKHWQSHIDKILCALKF